VLYHENEARRAHDVRVPPAVATPMFDKMKGGAKSTQLLTVLQPQEVLDAIERSLEKGELWASALGPR